MGIDKKRSLDEILMDFILEQKTPVTNEDFLEYEQQKILNNFLTECKYKRKELFPIMQWKKALFVLVPEDFNSLLDELNLIDTEISEKTDYNKILEECYNNITEINKFATHFKEKKALLDKPFNPVIIANIYKHLAIGLIAESEKYNYYNSDRQVKLTMR